ncbi:predicted protein [Sclerotinia sclerotiorum 1980 UF-70]|uniref:Uncharacterized protein n=1 Tax=Sclerotinia sclerotiorum (strain ATCC 18683 / 1980 / Ss-1) TaxID=665079 RepID=A7EMH6_SCLS1|nr:predicted protein [Sclerotinia sclerotiorum 1980 UF-70]EDO04042.1 predicted protein [Sclerotinia sclerotiorum 1980 UF-70]
MNLSTPESSPTTMDLHSCPNSSPPPTNPFSTPDSSPPIPHQAYTHCTISDPRTFSTWLDSLLPQTKTTLTYLTLLPSQHLGRMTSLSSLGDTLGDSLGDTTTYAELHAWITILLHLSTNYPNIRSLTIFFAADMSGSDTHGYRRGAGECVGFIWAIGWFRELDWVELGGYFPRQWGWYLRGLWGVGTRVLDGRGLGMGEAEEEYRLGVWRRGTEGLDSRGLGGRCFVFGGLLGAFVMWDFELWSKVGSLRLC